MFHLNLQPGVWWKLLGVFSFLLYGCSSYRHVAFEGEKTTSLIHFYIVNEKLPKKDVWKVKVDTVTKTGLMGTAKRAPEKEVRRIASHMPPKEVKSKKGQMVVFYVGAEYAGTLPDSSRIYFPFDKATHSDVYSYKGQSWVGPFLGGAIASPIILIAAVAAACGCPSVYTETPDGMVFEGAVFTGSTQASLERHDWLPLARLQPKDDKYVLQLANEDPEIQYLNLLELVVVEHPVNSTALFDKYGRLHIISQPEKPVSAVDLEGRDVMREIETEDERVFNGSWNNRHPRAEDGLVLAFNKPEGSREAQLVIRANTSQWLAYNYEKLHQEFGEYGPKVRENFQQKDSAALQQWILNQNIPLSVWLETAPDKWEKVDFFQPIGTRAPKNDVLQLNLTKIKGNQVRVKLATGFRFWEIDYVALNFTVNLTGNSRTLPLATAQDQEGNSLVELLAADDKQYYIQQKAGDVALLQFDAPPLTEGVQRSVMLHAKGYYEIQYEPVAGRPGKRYLKQFTKADAFPKYARENWNDLVRQEFIVNQ